jgi:ligand-binding sensor domain-containing protein/class 3 adenylate cyclase/predicted metal-dependent HD superfamily phosphohydrolase
MKALICLLILIVFAPIVSGQRNFRFRNYTINEGLSQSSATCIVQDEQNALWVGTQDGLNRFDGKNFVHYFSDNTEGLVNSHIRCSAIDSQGNLWFGTNNGLTVFRINEERFQTYTANSNISFQVEEIVVTDKDKIWLSTAELGVYLFDPEKQKFTNHSAALPSKRTNHLFDLKNGNLLISTIDAGLVLYDYTQKKTKSLRTQFDGIDFEVNKIFHYTDRSVGLATSIGVLILDKYSLKLEKHFTQIEAKYGVQSVSDVFLHPEVGWFIATNGNGLFTVYQDGTIAQSTEDIFQKNALLFNELTSVYQDHSGTIWLASRRGISNFNPLHKGFLGIGPSGNLEKGLSNPSVWSFAESKNGRFLFVGTDVGVSRLDYETGKFTQYFKQSAGKFKNVGEQAILNIYPLNDYHLLLGCADGFYELLIEAEGYSFRKINFEKELFQNTRVYKIVPYNSKEVFLATRDGVVLYNTSTRKSEFFEHNSKDAGNSISKGICRLVYKDRNDRFWFATSVGGLNLFSERNGTRTIRPYEYNSIIKGASSDFINAIHHDENGTYWLATSGSGLIKWNEKTKKAVVYSKADGLPNDVIYGVIKDNNKLWMSTNKGICSFDPKTKKVAAYTEVDGLMSNEFNLGAFYKSPSGMIYFGGIYGYNYFIPSELLENNQSLQVVFTGFKLDQEWITANSENSPLHAPIFKTSDIQLRYNQRSFTLRFQASDISNPDLLNYKYRLIGSEEGEIEIGSQNEIHFNALTHGKYRLVVYARIGTGPWSMFPAEITITIASPYWATWWFWVLVAVSLAIAIRIFIKRRIEGAKREQIHLEMKVRMRTKEIEQKNREIEQKNREIEAEKNKVIEQQRLLQIEKDKTERVLKNVIPESTAEELKKSGKARARAYKTVSVMFTDFVGFTNISDRTSPTELVKKLDVYFTKFDEIIVRNNLEKIKTIGDAYMCAGGVPVRNKTNPIDACLAALQIQDYIQRRMHDAIANGEEYWELRLGVNTGEVTAGVIGSERLAFDIWGATVNHAQRMEMLGAPGEVTITGETYQHIEPYFDVSFKGKAQTKSRGVIDMYVVARIKPELSENGEGIYPNERFHEIVNLHHYSSINYYKAERHIMKLLEQKLAKELHYHSIAHTKDVVSAAERIALLEGVTDEGLFVLKSAATYHDAGFVEQYDHNEPIGVRLAQEILPKYGYTQAHIDTIKELIYVTTIPHQPKTLLEEIMCDADLDYLGRNDFHEIADRLRRELREHGKINSDRMWDEIQVKFLTAHKYFTKTAKAMRDKKKAENLQEVIDRLKENNYKD